MTTLHIQLEAISRNISLFKNHLPPHQRLMAMIKASAYGTDATQMARYLEEKEIEMFGVAQVEEGVKLRQNGISKPIFIMHIAPHEVEKAIYHDLELSVSHPYIISCLGEEAKKQQKQTFLHLHVDTGMNRLGCHLDEVLACAHAITSHPFLRLSGLYTHFACADMPEQDFFNHQQMALFKQVHQQLIQEGFTIPWIHAANSAAAIRLHAPEWNLARVGLALYGVHTSQEMLSSLPLHPALSLHTRIVALHRCKKGDTISYGRLHKVEKEAATIAVLPIGYHDGLHRHFSETSWVLIHGKKAPMVGRICMDFMMVDVTDIPEVELEDSVILFGGDALSIEEFAERGGTIPHELLACLGPRIKRYFKLPVSTPDLLVPVEGEWKH